MINEVIQYSLLGLIILWLIILEVHFKDVKWRMSNLFQSWNDLTDDLTDEDVKDAFDSGILKPRNHEQTNKPGQD